jgi:hypothetical protein
VKRLLKFLARLYPSAWRNRYAAEFEALLDDRTPRTRDAFDVLLGALKMQMTKWSFTRITLATCVFGLLAAIAISFAVPRRYVSQGVILVDTEIAQDGLDTILANITKEVLNKSSVVPIIQKYNLYSGETSGMSPDAIINQMRKNITIRPVRPAQSTHGLPGFVINFSYPEPHIAQQVDADLVSLFTAANLRRRIASASEDGPRKRDVTFLVMDASTLPQKPGFPKRSLFGAGGLLAGLAAGLMLAFTARLRQNKAAASAG